MNLKPDKTMDIIVWDIETIPNFTGDTPVKDQKIRDKVDRRSSSNNTMNGEEIQNLIMGTNPFFGQIVVIASYEMSSRYPNGLERTLPISREASLDLIV